VLVLYKIILTITLSTLAAFLGNRFNVVWVSAMAD
jgi:hypothetical protein